jgi:hypothetical protein
MYILASQLILAIMSSYQGISVMARQTLALHHQTMRALKEVALLEEGL